MKKEQKINPFLSKLQKLEGAVTSEYDPFSDVIRTPSPSVNFIFGKGWGLPKGFSAILYGPPAGGKTLLVNAIIGQLHKDDPDALAIKFDTEFRELGQMTKETADMWGIDRGRYLCYSVNTPDLIFDRIEKDVAAICQEGGKVGVICIDSLTGIQGRLGMNKESVMDFTIGDEAMTLQIGLKRILPIIRKYKIALLLTVHVRAEMDSMEAKIGYNKSAGNGPTVKMASSWGTKHIAEYFLYVEENRSKKGRQDLLERDMIDPNAKDADGNPQRLGHKHRVTMKKSSFGGEGRTGEFTLSYIKGIVNQHEEIFLLGVNRGVIQRPTQSSYVFQDKKWTGKQAILQALLDSTDLQKEVMKELRRREDSGQFKEEDSLNQESLIVNSNTDE